MRVLVVEDEPRMAALLVRGLTAADFDVSVARSGEQALARVEDEEPEAIVLDVMLPGKSGLEFLSELRAKRGDKAIPVVVVSAWQSADDAFMSILRRLSDFRGDSRFTTWACKFAIVEAGVKVRRHAWRGREIPLAPAFWPVVADAGPGPQQHAEARDLLWALREEVERLTVRQREVFVAIALNDVPIDVLAERLDTTRGALYKTLHDARRKLRTALAARGLGIDLGERP